GTRRPAAATGSRAPTGLPGADRPTPRPPAPPSAALAPGPTASPSPRASTWGASAFWTWTCAQPARATPLARPVSPSPPTTAGRANQILVGGFTTTNQTLAADLTVGTAQPLNITNNGPLGLTTLTLTGTLTGNGATALNVGGQGDTTITGVLPGTFAALTKSGAGTLTLKGVTNSAGGTWINH